MFSTSNGHAANGHPSRNIEQVLHAECRRHFNADKWEYPWYAAWDLAFHSWRFRLVDFDFAKEQLLLMLRALYFQHPNGQIPALLNGTISDVRSSSARVGDAVRSIRLTASTLGVPTFDSWKKAFHKLADVEFQLVGEHARTP